MDGINNIEDKKETPLSVRVDTYYKDLFLELSDKPGYNRKRLLENMISSYIKSESEDNRKNNLDLEHEINLISGSLDDILKVFKTISAKAQDTIGSNKSYYEQQVDNCKKNMDTLELKLQNLEEERKELKLQNKELELKYKEVYEENKKLMNKLAVSEEELVKAKDSHASVLNEVYNLRRIEGENIKIIAENRELLVKKNDFERAIDKKEKEEEKLMYNQEVLEFKKNKEIELLQNQIINMEMRMKEELRASEMLIRKELELRKEGEILELKQEYNKLQMQYIKDIVAINNKE